MTVEPKVAGIAALLVVMCLALSSCSSQVICAAPSGSVIDALCVRSHLKPGDEVWVYLHGGTPYHGTYLGIRSLGADSSLLLTPSGTYGAAYDSDSVLLASIRSVRRVREATPEKFLFLGFAMTAVTALVLVSIIHMGVQ
jgi:hypothetical protein